MLSSNGCTPEHFLLGCVELKTIRLHQFCNVIHASRTLLMQLQYIRRRRVAADLRVVSIQMRNEVMLFDEPQQIGSVRKKKKCPEDWALRDTTGQSRWSRLRRAATDELCTAAEVGPEPAQNGNNNTYKFTRFRRIAGTFRLACTPHTHCGFHP